MRVTHKQLRRLIRESLLRENAELKKLKKLFLAGPDHRAQAWALVDSLGMAQQIEEIMRTDFRFLRKMIDSPTARRSPEGADLSALIGIDAEDAGGGPEYTPVTRTGQVLKNILEDSALEMFHMPWDEYQKSIIFKLWLTPAEQQQFDWKELASMLGTDSPLKDVGETSWRKPSYAQHLGGGTYGELALEDPGTRAVIDHLETMGPEGMPEFLDWAHTQKKRLQKQWLKAAELKYGPTN